jgi:protein-S-isoprenylcysteine O-methyltransferase Ste14
MAESLSILWSRLLGLRGGLFARFKEIFAKCAALWPWADRVLIFISFSIVVVRLSGKPPDLSIASLAFPLFLLIIVFRSPLLTGPLPTLSGFIGMVISYPALAFLQFPSQIPSQIVSGLAGVVYSATVLFYIMFLAWAFYSIGRSFAIFPSARIVVTGGPYNLVRHPIYSGYLHFALCYTVLTPTLRNFGVTAVFALGLLLRAKCEEGLLLRAEAYGPFRNRVRNRFFNAALSAPAAVAAAALWFARL